jgi:hypothetical protein
MNWQTSFNFYDAWNFFLSEIRADNLDFELLRLKLDFVEKANTILDSISTKYNFAMNSIIALVGVILTFITIALGLLYYSTNNNLKEATNNATEKIKNKVDQYIAEQIEIEVENAKRTLETERIVSETIVDYYIPDDSSETNEYKLFQQRGFKDVKFSNNGEKPETPLGQVFVLDLENIRNFSSLSQEDKEAETRKNLPIVLDWIKHKKAIVLVIYVNGHIKAINELLSQEKERYYTPANNAVTLMGRVVNAAYVAYGEENK